MSNNIPKTFDKNNQEKFRPLEYLSSREAEINKKINDQKTTFKDSVSEILDYSVEEIQNIDNLMNIVFEIDDLIDSWKDFSNHIKYHEFMTLYSLLNQKEKKHFNEIYNDYRVIYYYTKISNNIKNWWSLKLANITWYLNQFKNENFWKGYIDKFWSFFDNREKEFLLDYYEKKH